jgi:hypothetical protein
VGSRGRPDSLSGRFGDDQVGAGGLGAVGILEATRPRG